VRIGSSGRPLAPPPAPELLELFDALTDATRILAAAPARDEAAG
jgi:hypothetical protein